MQSGDTIAGRYVLASRLGKGGMAEVWRARDTVLDVDRAIKLLAPTTEHNAEPFRRRLHAEAKTMAGLAHPNVLTIFDLGVFEGADFIVMPLCKESLLDRLNRGEIPAVDAVRLTADVLSALEAAHEAGVVHRDIKPANVLIDQTGRAKLADFGIARLSGQLRETRTGVAMGSMAFMAPEQRLDARSVDARADVYSAGCMLYNLAVGASPVDMFASEESGYRMRRLPPQLRPIVYKATRYQPQHRYATAAQMAQALKDLDMKELAQSRGDVSPGDHVKTRITQMGSAFLTAPEPDQVTAPPTVPMPRTPTATPAIPQNEEARLEALWSLCILDTPKEERFERHTRLAQHLFGVDMALVSLVDRDRQWFKSHRGVDATETPRVISFCAHAINTPDQLFVVEDALNDPRFKQNPLVIGGPKGRFYAGHPLKGKDDLPLGTLCIIDSQPRTLDEGQKLLLADLAGMVEAELQGLMAATTDTMTGLHNMDGFKMVAQRVLGQVRQEGATLVHVALEDLRSTVGDSVIDPQAIYRIFGEVLEAAWPDAAVIARVEGNEFCALLLEPPTQDYGELLRAALNDDERIRAVCSVSWAHLDPKQDPPLLIIENAARASTH